MGWWVSSMPAVRHMAPTTRHLPAVPIHLTRGRAGVAIAAGLIGLAGALCDLVGAALSKVVGTAAGAVVANGRCGQREGGRVGRWAGRRPNSTASAGAMYQQVPAPPTSSLTAAHQGACRHWLGGRTSPPGTFRMQSCRSSTGQSCQVPGWSSCRPPSFRRLRQCFPAGSGALCPAHLWGRPGAAACCSRQGTRWQRRSASASASRAGAARQQATGWAEPCKPSLRRHGTT